MTGFSHCNKFKLNRDDKSESNPFTFGTTENSELYQRFIQCNEWAKLSNSMASWKDGMYCMKWNTNSVNTNLTDSKLNSHSVSSRNIMKYSYNLGMLSSEIDKVSDGISSFRCGNEDYNENCVLSKNACETGRTFEKTFNSSSFYNFQSKPNNLNSIAMTSLLQKWPVSPVVDKLQELPSTVRESEQEVTGKTVTPTIYEIPQNANSNIKQEDETKGDIGIGDDTSAKITLFPPADSYTTQNSNSVMKEKKKHFALPCSPTAKFRRAARRLGVIIPAQELYNKKRRNGFCEAMDIDPDQRKLLRILNKRF